MSDWLLILVAILTTLVGTCIVAWIAWKVDVWLGTHWNWRKP